MVSLSLHVVALCLFVGSVFAFPRPVPAQVARGGTGRASRAPLSRKVPDTQVLILGGGVAGIIAARTLAAQGITDFLIVEAREGLGGRMCSTTFGAPNRQLTVELGANWIHGTQEENGPANPIFDLAHKHNLDVVDSDVHTNSSALQTWTSSFCFFVRKRYLMGEPCSDIRREWSCGLFGCSPECDGRV